MNIREFWLTNSKSEKYNLNNKSHFLYLPQGLGFQKSYVSTRIGNNEKIDNETFNMVDVGGELIFTGTIENCYQEYDNFIEFIKYKPLQLHYKTPNKVYGYYADIVITQIQKTELGEDNTLHCPITFHRATQWKNDNLTKLAFTNEVDTDGKYYDYTYDYHYAQNSLGNISPIANNGTEECPFIFEIISENGVTNPSFTLLQNNVPYGIIKLDGTFTYVRIDSDELNESIYLEDENGVPIPMPYNYQVIESDNLFYTWLKLKVGENSAIFNASDVDTFDGVIKLTYAEKRATT